MGFSAARRRPFRSVTLGDACLEDSLLDFSHGVVVHGRYVFKNGRPDRLFAREGSQGLIDKQDLPRAVHIEDEIRGVFDEGTPSFLGFPECLLCPFSPEGFLLQSLYPSFQFLVGWLSLHRKILRLCSSEKERIPQLLSFSDDFRKILTFLDDWDEWGGWISGLDEARGMDYGEPKPLSGS